MKQTHAIIEDGKCDVSSAKYAVDGYKKCFVAQLTDRKKAVHIEACNLLNAMIKSQTKAFKPQLAHYLKHCMNYLDKKKSESTVAIEGCIKLMIATCIIKDNKSLGVIIAELIRFGSSAKNKSIRANGWKYIVTILKKYETKKGGQTKEEDRTKRLILG
eukprot:TRINITY_DN1835_c0_g1_i1.p1 TRINITY_DN1835_c0_g1~~TRINITY_DN1835_c0_g1_i1.p1  ORF type:complete len:159 (-),score=12.29 TRINITY_DN1835_c0_g1_i1:250-726(-)